jgi:ABC-type transport system involved in multi-copper enzyme maturation permease subunit
VIEMVRRFHRQRFGSPATSIAHGVLAVMTGITAAMSDPEQALGLGFFAMIVIAAGSVSKDVSGGALQMILARPIRRTSYLFGRYLGILAAYASFVAASTGLAVLFTTALPRLFGASGMPPSALALGRGAAAAMANALLFAAILLFFSTFLAGYADVLAYFLLSLFLGVLPQVATSLGRPGLGTAAEKLRENVLPKVDWGAVLRGTGVASEATGRYVFAVIAFLVLAAVVFSRREFAYGHD